MNVIIGLSMLILGGISAGSSYVPLKGVKGWAWESLWAVQGIVAWLLLPLLLALLSTPHLVEVLRSVPFSTLVVTYLLGLLWGFGGLAWGFAVRYIGLSLGFSIATGFLSSLGTLVPIVVAGRMQEVLSTTSGKITLCSIALSLLGIFICGRAGMRRDRERTAAEQASGSGTEDPDVPGFQFKKGILIAGVAGVLAACFAFGITAGDPIRQKAIEAGASPLWATTPVFFVELLGGITVNLVYCLFMNERNKTFSDYRSGKIAGVLAGNYLFSSLVGALWYLQFVFYGMAAFYMGTYSFTNWSVHMSFMVVASNLWGYFFKEWKGASANTIRWNNIGILVLVVAGIIMGVAQAWQS
ncbi:MAG TPA: L-rhamnose/proton symporter RhaT [Puia sp.]|nr:L-rhamnose/proton symporter RhaT [Puia sp.]